LFWTRSKEFGEYDPKTLVIVVNRDSSDVTIIDPATDKVVSKSPSARTPMHMAMPSHDGKKILISATGRDRFLVVDLVTGKVEHTVKTERHRNTSMRRQTVG
jgi:YVTN family beta-propeller protein